MEHNKAMGKHGSQEHKALVKAMHDSGKSYPQIESLLGIPKSTAHRWIKEIEEIQPLADTFADNRITLLRADQIRVRDHVTDEKLKKAQAKDLVAMQKQYWEMERIEAGKSTQNIGLAMYSVIRDYKKKKQEAIDTEGREVCD